MTLDVHNLAAFQNAFRCRTEHLEANMLFVEHFVPVLKDSEVVVVSPDAGGVKRAERLRQLLSHALGKPVGAAFAEKYRSLGVVSGDMVVGDVEGKNVIIVDDLISTGTTIARTGRACHTREAFDAKSRKRGPGRFPLAGAFSGGKSRLRLGGLLNLFVNPQQVLPGAEVSLESETLRKLVA